MANEKIERRKVYNDKEKEREQWKILADIKEA